MPCPFRYATLRQWTGSLRAHVRKCAEVLGCKIHQDHVADPVGKRSRKPVRWDSRPSPPARSKNSTRWDIPTNSPARILSRQTSMSRDLAPTRRWGDSSRKSCSNPSGPSSASMASCCDVSRDPTLMVAGRTETAAASEGFRCPSKRTRSSTKASASTPGTPGSIAVAVTSSTTVCAHLRESRSSWPRGIGKKSIGTSKS